MTPKDRDPDRDQEEVPRVVIRDKRRLDPETGELREAVPGGQMPGPAHDDVLPDTARELAERTADLQRVSAEYANYRRRVDRDRLASAEQAAAQVLFALLPVLDTIDRARQHGDLTGAFAAAAEQLEGTLDKVGLTAFGEVGDSFDPTRHEAVMHSTSPDVEEPACVEIMRHGYSFGERLLRPAMVAVADPEVTVPSESSPGASSEADG